MDRAIDPSQFQQGDILYQAYQQIDLFHCPGIRPKPSQTRPFALHYTINSIDFSLYRSSGQYEATPFQKITAIPAHAATAYLCEINDDGVLSPQSLGVVRLLGAVGSMSTYHLH